MQMPFVKSTSKQALWVLTLDINCYKELMHRWHIGLQNRPQMASCIAKMWYNI